MTTRGIFGSVALVVALGFATSCSDNTKKSADTTATAISKAEFLAQGNALCTTFNGTVDAATATVVTEADQIAVLTDTIIPGLRETLTGIEDLGYPAGDEALIHGVVLS